MVYFQPQLMGQEESKSRLQQHWICMFHIMLLVPSLSSALCFCVHMWFNSRGVCLKVWFVMIVLFSFAQWITGIIPGPSHFQTKRLRFYVPVSEHNKNLLILTKYWNNLYTTWWTTVHDIFTVPLLFCRSSVGGGKSAPRDSVVCRNSSSNF